MCIFFDKLYTRVMFCIFYSSKKAESPIYQVFVLFYILVLAFQHLR